MQYKGQRSWWNPRIDCKIHLFAQKIQNIDLAHSISYFIFQMTILLRMDDKMNRQLTCHVSRADTAVILSQELVHLGFIHEVLIFFEKHRFCLVHNLTNCSFTDWPRKNSQINRRYAAQLIRIVTRKQRSEQRRFCIVTSGHPTPRQLAAPARTTFATCPSPSICCPLQNYYSSLLKCYIRTYSQTSRAQRAFRRFVWSYIL